MNASPVRRAVAVFLMAFTVCSVLVLLWLADQIERVRAARRRAVVRSARTLLAAVRHPRSDLVDVQLVRSRDTRTGVADVADSHGVGDRAEVADATAEGDYADWSELTAREIGG